jgi:hypothetical protein
LIVAAISSFFIRSSVKSRLAKQAADSLGHELFLLKNRRDRLLDFGPIRIRRGITLHLVAIANLFSRASSLLERGDTFPVVLHADHPRMFLSGVQFRIRLDSRLKHAGMTVFRNQLDAARLWGINRSDLK